MITLRLPARVFLCLAPTDMRKSFDGLASVVSSRMAADPLAGDLFVFRGASVATGSSCSISMAMATRCGTSDWKKARLSFPLANNSTTSPLRSSCTNTSAAPMPVRSARVI